MSPYPLGTANPPSDAGVQPQPTAISTGQFVRTLLIFVVCVLALAFAARQSHATNKGHDDPGQDVTNARKAGGIGVPVNVDVVTASH